MNEPRWPWQTSYNGWTWTQRCAVNPVQRRLFLTGQLARPTECSICGFSDPARIETSGYIFAHTERYDRPAAIHPCCRKCHAALHARFREPERWQAVLKANYREGEWFTLLSLDPASQWRPYAETYPADLPSARIRGGE